MVEYQRNPPLFGDREEMDNFYCTLSVTPNVVQITFYVVNLEKNTKSDHCSKFTSWCVTIITRIAVWQAELSILSVVDKKNELTMPIVFSLNYYLSTIFKKTLPCALIF